MSLNPLLKLYLHNNLSHNNLQLLSLNNLHPSNSSNPGLKLHNSSKHRHNSNSNPGRKPQCNNSSLGLKRLGKYRDNLRGRRDPGVLHRALAHVDLDPVGQVARQV